MHEKVGGLKMKNQLVEEICKEFNLDTSLSVNEMIKELTKLQKAMHPDLNPNYSKSDSQKFTKINVAKDYLRTLKNQTIVPVPNVFNYLVKKTLDNNITLSEYEEKLSEKISICSDKIFKKAKDYYFPKKISVVSCAVFFSVTCVILFLIISRLISRSTLNYYMDYFIMLILIFWFCIITTLFFSFVKIIKNEYLIKKAVNELGETELQFEIFKEFANQRNAKEKFQKNEMEDFISQYIKKRYFYNRSFEELYPYINDIVPKVTDMIIFRAINKKFINELNDSWDDEYTFVRDKVF